MRYLLIITLSVFVLPLLLPSARLQAGVLPVEIFDVMDDQKLVIFLQDEDIAASPQWNPAEGGPPFTIADALNHARQSIEKDPRLTQAEVYDIELKPIRDHKLKHRWYYLLHLRAMENGKPRNYFLAILLGGKVVPAIAEPASIK